MDTTSIRVNLSRHARNEFFVALKENQIEFVLGKGVLGSIQNSLETIDIINASIAAIACVLVAWLRGRTSRSVMIQTKNHEVIHVKGESVDEVVKLLREAVSLNVIQTTKDDPK